MESGTIIVFMLVDALSKWPEVKAVSSTTSEANNYILQDIFQCTNFHKWWLLIMVHSLHWQPFSTFYQIITSLFTSQHYTTSGDRWPCWERNEKCEGSSKKQYWYPPQHTWHFNDIPQNFTYNNLIISSSPYPGSSISYTFVNDLT